jgi:hypothetical protein
MKGTQLATRFLPNRMVIQSCFGILGYLLLAVGAAAQNPNQGYLEQLGSPTFSTANQLPGGLGFINFANGNLHIEVPLGSYPQRGTSGPLSAKLIYDSRQWQPIGSVGAGATWKIPRILGGWTIMTSHDAGTAHAEDVEIVFCSSGGTLTEWGLTSGFAWIEPNNTMHVFQYNSLPATTAQAVPTS